MNEVTIIILGDQFTGKSVLASRIKQFLVSEGYIKVSVDFEMQRLPENTSPFSEYPIQILTTNNEFSFPKTVKNIRYKMQKSKNAIYELGYAEGFDMARQTFGNPKRAQHRVHPTAAGGSTSDNNSESGGG